MIRKIGFATIWVGLAIYAFFLAPPNQPDTFELIKNLSIGEINGINPLIVALFYIMGVWPMIYSCLLFFDGKAQKIPAFPFAALSFGVGAFALLPYLALRESSTTFPGQKNAFLKLLDSRWIGITLMIAAVLIVSYGFSNGDWGDYIYQWRTSRFIHVMSLDFCLLCLLFPALVRDDMARRGLDSSSLYWVTALIPLFGPLIYLCVRPPLAEQTIEASI
jgi:hypothetical protein